MNHSEYSQQIQVFLQQSPNALPAITVDDSRRNNAGRCMTSLTCNRLSQSSVAPEHVRHTTFNWKDGTFALRNARIVDHHWSTAQVGVVQQMHELAADRPVVFLLTYWAVDDGVLHAWVVPEDVAFDAFAKLPTNRSGDHKTVEVTLDDHLLKNAPSAPSFAPFYVSSPLTDDEIGKLQEAIKTDDLIKQERLEAETTQTVTSDDDINSTADEEAEDDSSGDVSPGYTDETVVFLLDLPAHVEDGAWHEKNKKRYQTVLRDPSQNLVEELRAKYIHQLSPVVAGGKRHLSILKKNDYGKGGYHDHYWFAFYDPAAGSKTKSVQLFVRFLGSEEVWRYGFSMGNYCGPYMDRLLTAMLNHRQVVADYVRSAPPETIVRLYIGEQATDMTGDRFADVVMNATDLTFGLNGPLSNVNIIREFSLDSLPEHSDNLVDTIGEYFRWAWPFFEASMTGEWKAETDVAPRPGEDETSEVDENVPQTIEALADLTALPNDFLSGLEDALWAKQQAVLVGPPGTSKTYIARQFARYFVRQRRGRPQGSFDVLYMHANWAYEDFFEGLKPTSKNGALNFESRLGFFLECVERLKDHSPKALHVLVLDEINRCDTAAVLGELLQLLEYRGTTVRLLSGRSFVFPRNLFIIGTMNSADRSIGRMDLALRRRFLWIDLHPRIETLERWLKRPGNNPLGFPASTLAHCNDLLAEHGIPPEQQIGHALFMLQRTAEDEEASPKLDIPLSEKQLRQIVRYSVLPYVRELLTMQFGQADENLLNQISSSLLQCVDGTVSGQQTDSTDADS